MFLCKTYNTTCENTRLIKMTIRSQQVIEACLSLWHWWWTLHRTAIGPKRLKANTNLSSPIPVCKCWHRWGCRSGAGPSPRSASGTRPSHSCSRGHSPHSSSWQAAATCATPGSRHCCTGCGCGPGALPRARSGGEREWGGGGEWRSVLLELSSTVGNEGLESRAELYV